ncbi:uncharacterized protein BO96DRAFT_124725 [Aspergillus niger CBS 101883]|uniref:uncharacterized protein n=1 Tax=Aspergillus lacticoffeatus (strain CBS 101883) TaxID=1450533 RepID=UPI000D7FA37D|nr:uncharacterized protein BO96DRAFT_124725 [Aspergillus niger CBS 101883]PYH53623.1 hypothetical protein BO96DRAFT_124725 [Aspergillus niger CBS 101883]
MFLIVCDLLLFFLLSLSLSLFLFSPLFPSLFSDCSVRGWSIALPSHISQIAAGTALVSYPVSPLLQSTPPVPSAEYTTGRAEL